MLLSSRKVSSQLAVRLKPARKATTFCRVQLSTGGRVVPRQSTRSFRVVSVMLRAVC